MKVLGTYYRDGARPYHGRCIHNDHPPKTHNFTMRGMFGAVVWVALWSLIIVGFISADVRQSQRHADAFRGRHIWMGVRRGVETVGFAECSKCGLDTRNPGVRMNDGPCPENRASN